MRRRDRPTTWGLWGTYRPVITRDLSIEVDERVLADGTVRTPVDIDDVTRAALVQFETRSGRGRRRDRAIGRSRPPKTAAQVVLGAGLCLRSETRGGCRTVVGAHVLAGHALALDEILLPELHADTLSVL